MVNKIIRNFIAKRIAGRSDDGIMITLKDPQRVTLGENIMADLLMRNGIDPRAITSENQLKLILQQIENAEAAAIRNTDVSGIRGTTSAKIFNIEGQKLDPNKPIIGGTQTGKELSPELSERLRGTNVDRIKQKIADKKIESDEPPPVMNVEDVSEDFMNFVNRTDPEAAAKLKKANDEIKAKIEAGNKRYLDKIRKQKEEGTYKRYNPEEGSKLDLEIKEEFQKAIKGESKLFAGKFEGTEDDFRNMLDEMTDDFAEGGRVGLKVGTGFRFLQKIFGKDKFKEMATRDPEMYQGLLEVVDMYRKRDKEGLKMYLQKFLPHMDDAQIEDFIRGSDGTEGLIGELIRLGSGRDYAGKIEMMKRAENMRKLDDLEVTDDMIRKPNADGGRIGYKLGTGIEAAIAENKKLQSEIEENEMIRKFLEAKNEKMQLKKDILDAPEGVLMDPPFHEQMPKGGSTIVPNMSHPDRYSDFNVPYIVFDDGTIFYPNPSGGGGEFIDRKTGETVDGPSPNAKPINTKKVEAKDGGIMRLGFKDGMNRRTFLKIFSGLVSLPIIGKVLKPLKVGKKVTQVPIIKTGDVPGKPEWFDQLVNKVILEGDDVTKRFATQERQVVHMKKIDDETSVTVTQDLNDGSIVVDVDDPIRNVMGESGDDTSVMMMLKKNPGDESSPAGPDEFSFTEADMRNYMDGPDDYTTEFTENTVRKMKDLTSDLGKIRSYATGKKPTMKEFIESKKRQDKVRFAEEKPAEYASERGPDIDYSDYDDGMASGGIARMLGE